MRIWRKENGGIEKPWKVGECRVGLFYVGFVREIPLLFFFSLHTLSSIEKLRVGRVDGWLEPPLEGTCGIWRWRVHTKHQVQKLDEAGDHPIRMETGRGRALGWRHVTIGRRVTFFNRGVHGPGLSPTHDVRATPNQWGWAESCFFFFLSLSWAYLSNCLDRFR